MTKTAEYPQDFESQDLPKEWQTPFSELFPALTQPGDIVDIPLIQVPENFFVRDPNVLIGSDSFTQRFIYFLAQKTSTPDSSLDQLRTQAKQIEKKLKTLNLSMGIRSSRTGFCLAKNFKIYQLYKELNLISLLPTELAQEGASFANLFSKIVSKVTEGLNQKTENSAELALEWSQQLIERSLALSPQEILTIVTKGPIVDHLNKAFKPQETTAPEDSQLLSDEQAMSFLQTNYPVELNNNSIKIARITGSDKFLFLQMMGWFDELTQEEYKEKVAEVGLVKATQRTLFSMVTHLPGWIDIKLFNLAVTVPEVLEPILATLDYLKPQWSEIQKVMIYSLGILAHEFIHRLQTTELMKQYQTVASKTWSDKDKPWEGYASDYIQFYAREYPDDQERLLREDMADSVQIYVINSEYLKTNFPERYEFISQTFPHLVPDSAANTINNPSSRLS